MCATTSRVRQPSHSDGASHTTGSAASSRSASATYSSAMAAAKSLSVQSAVVDSGVMAVPLIGFGVFWVRPGYPAEIGVQAVERGQEPGLGLGSQERLGHVGLVDPYLGEIWAERHELGADAHARVGLGPGQELGLAHLVVYRVRRVLAAVRVVDHDGPEHATGTGVDLHALTRRGHARRPPEMYEVIRVRHAAEHELAWCGDDTAETQLVGRARRAAALTAHAALPWPSLRPGPAFWFPASSSPAHVAGRPAAHRACRSARPTGGGGWRSSPARRRAPRARGGKVGT